MKERVSEVWVKCQLDGENNNRNNTKIMRDIEVKQTEGDYDTKREGGEKETENSHKRRDGDEIVIY